MIHRDAARDAGSEEARCHRLDEFMMAVAAGWPQVMSFLASCTLDGESRSILEQLRRDDPYPVAEGGAHRTWEEAYRVDCTADRRVGRAA